MRQIAVIANVLKSGAFFAGVFALSASAFAADTQLLNLVMPDAQAMAGINVTTAKISPFGTYLLAQLSANDQGLQDFVAMTGFDPRQDVTEILAASAGNPSAPGGLVLARGNFNVDKLLAAIGVEKKLQVSTYAGATLITGTDAKDLHAFAFIGSSIAVAGDMASVKAALDRSTGVNSINPALATRVQALSTTEDAWSVSLASLASMLPGGLNPSGAAGNTTGNPGPALQFVRNIQSSSGGVKFGATIDVTGQAVTDTPQNATALADLVRMISSLVSMSAAQNPQAGQAVQILQSLKVSADGSAVNLSLSIPEAQVESLVRLASSAKTGPTQKSRKL